jgi:hypothetical protein
MLGLITGIIVGVIFGIGLVACYLAMCDQREQKAAEDWIELAIAKAFAAVEDRVKE